jgi:hypothetical protein
VEEKLEEYLQWGMRLMETHAAHLRRIAPGHLLTEHPLREKSLDALVRATLAWAYSHTEDPDFLRRSPSELADEELAFLERMAGKLEKPLREAAETLRRGEKLPLLGARTLVNGSRMLPGSPEHMAQRWVDYQFRHPGKYRRFSYAVDPEWERLYRSILDNKPAGNAFEDSILKAQSYEKNAAMMMPPPGRMEQGFVPDSVRGNPAELVWGQPYRFIEAKGRQELALTGNLKAMIEYVRDHGGHLELWIRSAKHPAGATRLTDPLRRQLMGLAENGKATVMYYPP